MDCQDHLHPLRNGSWKWNGKRSSLVHDRAMRVRRKERGSLSESEMEKALKLAVWIIVLGVLCVITPRPVAANGSPTQGNANLFPSESHFQERRKGSLVIQEEEVFDVWNGTYIWPLPKQWSKGTTTLAVDPQLELVLRVNGGKGKGSGIVAEAFERFSGHIYAHQREKDVRGKIRRRRTSADGPAVQKLIINVLSNDETLNLGTDESYNLEVPAPGKNTEAVLEAGTVYGAVRGLETFSQLVQFNFTKKQVEIAETPWLVKDEPRFKYRGLLIDTSRHFLPVETIRKVIDSMSYAKLNVLHWHIVDSQSFPLEIPSYPNLWDGSYSLEERYTVDDAKDIVEYARKRGINVMPELDVPGHAASWGYGYPELWPSLACQQPLDASKNFTFDVISGILADLRKIFYFDLVHLGGDEVDTTCWMTTPHIVDWLAENKLTPQDLYANFVLKAQTVALGLNWTPVNWEEPFNYFPERLDPHTIIHEWLSNDIVPDIVRWGFKAIVSNQDVWYLDHLNVPWEYFYLNEPLTNLSDPQQQEAILGGEVCMWGETADPSDIDATIWPRAAAAAERLWSPASTTTSTDAARPRIHNFRCLLNKRGVGAAPVENKLARDGPPYPGSRRSATLNFAASPSNDNDPTKPNRDQRQNVKIQNHVQKLAMAAASADAAFSQVVDVSPSPHYHCGRTTGVYPERNGITLASLSSSYGNSPSASPLRVVAQADSNPQEGTSFHTTVGLVIVVY